MLKYSLVIGTGSWGFTSIDNYEYSKLFISYEYGWENYFIDGFI